MPEDKMNERIKQIAASSLLIKQLAKQAEEYADIEYNASDLDWYELKEEKFAELIVQECATVIERNLFQGIGWNTSRAVRQHFGINNDD